MSSGAFVIEVRGETAGLVVVDDDSYRFVASQPAFFALDGLYYASVRQARRAADELWQRRVRGGHARSAEPALATANDNAA